MIRRSPRLQSEDETPTYKETPFRVFRKRWGCKRVSVASSMGRNQSLPVTARSGFHDGFPSCFSILLWVFTALLIFFLVFQFSTGFSGMNLVLFDSQAILPSHQKVAIVQTMTKDLKNLKMNIDHLREMIDSLSAGVRHIQDQQEFHRDRIMALEDASATLRQEVSSLHQCLKDITRPPAIQMADYALESLGGTIVNNSPWTVIEGHPPKPGRCWPFQGSEGFLTVSLSCPIHITHVTVEHIPAALSLTGNIASAPRDFSVYGISNEEDRTLLGTFTFNQAGDSVQTFELPEPSSVYQIVELRVLNNWGNKHYTCLYRFQVHGKKPPD
ncbi:hypothetical protein DPEC_G00218750 [Dallia pectoralis]|uniref:Uncharacterized protein n=1 Tax=Dallia pectoralis TaxID=75939 RepID=A0ACC2G3N2_DALPE|nr:hypothetical protein DPEC_G00218750 [Dallia pectoralis]